MEEIILHNILAGEVSGAEHQTQHRYGWAFGAVIGLIILAAIILRLAAAELVPGWVVIPVIALAGILYGCGLRHLSDCGRIDRAYAYICPECGAYLDPGEVCDCGMSADAGDEESNEREDHTA